MALTQCPECGQSVSNKASKCPKCGYPIQEYLNSKSEQGQTENFNNTALEGGRALENEQSLIPKRGKKKHIIAILAICIIVVVLGIVLGSNLIAPQLTVADINISKWRLTDSTRYGDYYEGTLASDQKKPFVAVIGQYEDEKSIPKFVYMENGEGAIETYEDVDEDPSIKYKAIGYMCGRAVDLSNIDVKYTDSNYNDWEYDETTNCVVLINIDMHDTKSGLLVFDIVNETNNETEKNKVVEVINGRAEYNYYAELPYKARGIDVSLAPKMFCESNEIMQEDYVVEKAYTAEKDEGDSYQSYSGEQKLLFTDYANGFVLYTRELKEGGNKENRNIIKNLSTFLYDNECALKTYDYASEDEKLLMPKYEFNIVGYVTWMPLEKESN